MLKSINDCTDLWFRIGNNFVNFKTGEKHSLKTLPKDIDRNACLTLIKYDRDPINNIAYVTVIRKLSDNELFISSGLLDYNSYSSSKPTPILNFQNVSSCVFNNKKQILSSDGDMKLLIRGSLYDSKQAIEDVKSMFPNIVITSGNNFLYLDDMWKIKKFLMYKEPAKKPGPIQKALDELTALTPEMSHEALNTLFKETKSLYSFKGYNGVACISKIEGYKEPCVCMRTFAYHKKRADDISFFEGNRVYITSKKIYVGKRNNAGEYITASVQRPRYWKYQLIQYNPDDCKNTMLEYYASVINEVHPCYRTNMLFFFLKLPVVESLYKSGYKNIVAAMLKRDNGSYSEVLESVLGTINNKGKSLYSIVGMNKEQLKVMDDTFKESYKDVFYLTYDKDHKVINQNNFYQELTPNKIKRAIGENVNDYDITTFNNVVDIFKASPSFMFYSIENTISDYISLYGIESLNKKKDMFINILKRENGFGASLAPREGTLRLSPFMQADTYRLFRDYISMVQALDDTHNFRCDFKDYNELHAAHEAALTVYNLKTQTVDNEKFTAAAKKLCKYEYTGEKYIVKAPVEANEVAYEGITLHHCVKSYIGKICGELTGIVFIRNINDPDTPYYTVEVQRDTIIQIHGFGNCCVPKDSALYSFVLEWAKAKNLKIRSVGFNIVR